MKQFDEEGEKLQMELAQKKNLRTQRDKLN